VGDIRANFVVNLVVNFVESTNLLGSEAKRLQNVCGHSSKLAPMPAAPRLSPRGTDPAARDGSGTVLGRFENHNPSVLPSLGRWDGSIPPRPTTIDLGRLWFPPRPRSSPRPRFFQVSFEHEDEQEAKGHRNSTAVRFTSLAHLHLKPIKVI